MDITNKSRKPLSLPLPAGKKLFLGPGKTGQVTPKALDHPPLKKLLDAGDVEVDDAGAGRKGGNRGGDDQSGPSTGSGKQGTGAMRQSGDR